MRVAPVLLISPDGMLGRAWQRLLQTERLPFEGVSYPSFDLRERGHVERAIDARHATVINCAAYTDVDGAEQHEAEATAINAVGAGLLAERCRAVGARLVHYSTDYVFDGRASTPYSVDAPRAPQNAYGRSKALGEERIVESGALHLTVRTSWLYAPWGKNFVDTIARAARERPVLRVVHDQRGRPTSAEALAAQTLRLLQRDARGTFHVTDGGECTWFELAREIVTQEGLLTRVEPCTTDEFPRPARRPAYSVLDLSRTEALLGPVRAWQSNLRAVLHARRQ